MQGTGRKNGKAKGGGLEGKKMGREKNCLQPFSSSNNVLPVDKALQSSGGRFAHV